MFNARLAQLEERHIDIVKARGSNPLPGTKFMLKKFTVDDIIAAITILVLLALIIAIAFTPM